LKSIREIFSGFSDPGTDLVGIPNQFFRDVLGQVSEGNQLKVCLYIFWQIDRAGDFSLAFQPKDFLADTLFMEGLAIENPSPEQALKNILDQFSEQNILIKVVSSDTASEAVYFLNCPQGKRAAQQSAGTLAGANGALKPTLDIIQSNIYKMYQDNIGPLTPIIADELRETEQTYPEEWIKEAIQIAVKNNVRRWQYVMRILERWQEEGRYGSNQRDPQKDYRKYAEGKFGEIGRHYQENQ